MKNKDKTINWKVWIGYILMVSTFLLYGLSFLTNEGMILFVPVPILWLSWLIYSVYLLIKPEFKFHGKILFAIWILIILFIIGFFCILLIFSSPLATISKTISIQDLQCKDGRITIILLNDGTMNISDSEIIVMVDGVNKSDNFTFNPIPILAGTESVATSSETYEMNKHHTILITSPSNSVRETLWC
jgi:hypothetical protein